MAEAGVQLFFWAIATGLLLFCLATGVPAFVAALALFLLGFRLGYLNRR